MNILSLHSGHDASVALLRDGKVVAAISEERLSRIKCDSDDLPLLSLEELYKFTDSSPADADFLALLMTFMPEEYFVRETLYKELERKWVRTRRRLKSYLKGETFKSVLLVGNLADKLKKREKALEDHFRWEKFRRDFGFNSVRWKFYDHHSAHAWPAVYFSNWDEALVVTIDGMGDDRIFHTTSIFRDGKLERVAVSRGAASSAGLFYCDITKILGFKPLRHEGKVTGLSAHGDPSKLLQSMRPCLRLSHDKMTFVSDFSEKRGERDRFRYLQELVRAYDPADIAAAAQRLVEEVVVEHVREALRRFKVNRVALSGGLFANVKLNHEIAELDEVEEVFVFPAMGDTGNAVGAALLGMQDNDRGGFWAARARLDDVYWGPSYSRREIEKSLVESKVSFKEYAFEDLAREVAKLIHSGRVVGCFQGRMEFGPRALGNRSILAAPTDKAINDWLNKRLDRTEFMPFAPSVLEPYADDIFKNYSKGAYTSKFMTIIFEVYEKWASKIPAVVHVDGTARPQVVSRRDSPRYYDIIQAYYELSGIPLVLNTSFNVHEEPIICRPVEAIKALKDMRIDALMIEDFLVFR